jgi:aldose 1-epimerase
MTFATSHFGRSDDGVDVHLHRLSNDHGLVLSVTDFGACIVALEAPDREGRLANINLGYPSLEGYLVNSPYFGATVGRFCNRIAGGRFSLDGSAYRLATNEGPNHLHGGMRGFNRVIWTPEPLREAGRIGVVFSYLSEDGEEGYPGRLSARVTYALTEGGEFITEFSATIDRPCPVNLTNHCYWNLGGVGSGTVYDHELWIDADRYLPTDDSQIPTGELAKVEGLPFDFRKPATIGSRLSGIGAEPPGYDHCYVLRDPVGGRVPVVRVRHPASGRVMELRTSQPGLQLYTGNHLDGSPASGGHLLHEGFCLETQGFPDSPNQARFPSTILRPGQIYRQETVIRFGVEG